MRYKIYHCFTPKAKFGPTETINKSFIKNANSESIEINDAFRDDFDGVLVIRNRKIRSYEYMIHANKIGRPFIFIDTGYVLGRTPNQVSKPINRVVINHTDKQDLIPRPDDRWKKLAARGAVIKDWQRDGSDILVCPPTNKTCVLAGITVDEWINKTVEKIKKHTDRKILIRTKPELNDRKSGDTLPAFINSNSIYAVVTMLGCVGAESIMEGIPIFTHPDNAASPLGCTDLSKIETPVYPDRQEWLNSIAYCQFTKPEFEDGTAWKIIKENLERMGYNIDT